MPRLPRPVDTSHTHLTESLVDRETRSPYPLKDEVEEAKTLPALPAGEQRIRLLGPFRVNFDDAGMEPDGSGVRLGAAIAANTHIISAWVGLLTAWDNAGDNPVLTIDLWWEHANGEDQPGLLGEALFSRRVTSSAYGTEGGVNGYPVVGTVGPRHTAQFSATQVWRIGPAAYFVRDEVQLGVKLFSGGNPGSPSQGAADIYALIAEPAE